MRINDDLKISSSAWGRFAFRVGMNTLVLRGDIEVLLHMAGLDNQFRRDDSWMSKAVEKELGDWYSLR